jgi:fumarate hydratase subunit beta
MKSEKLKVNMAIRITTPLNSSFIRKLKIGQKVLISGRIYTARDTVHKLLYDLIQRRKPLPVELTGQVIYYAGPAPTKPGYVIGPIGPTTSGRCDRYTPALLKLGLKGMLGKGSRSEDVKKAMRAHQAVYFAVTGGAAAFVAQSVRSVKTIAFPELGPEAINMLEVEDLPAIVAIDCRGNDLYESGPKKYRKTDKKEEK